MTFEKVQKIICEQFDIEPQKITRNTMLETELGADSLDLIDLVMALEDEFDITFSDECVLEIKTVSDLVNYIEKNAD